MQGHDVIESRELGPDPGDRALLDWAAKETRILVTIDTDFGQLIYLENLSHAGLIRLPDVPARERQLIIQDLLTRYETELQDAAIIKFRGGRIRISNGPNRTRDGLQIDVFGDPFNIPKITNTTLPQCSPSLGAANYHTAKLPKESYSLAC
jgi:predicted nuclease of predicted toxin-antitoxin system